MRFDIYHADKPTFGFGKDPKFPEEYTKVATVDADEVDDTFRITNHIEHNWTTNPEVIEMYSFKARSTSVGDVVVDENGIAHYCDQVGWKVIAKRCEVQGWIMVEEVN